MLSTLLSALSSLGTSALNNQLMSNRADKEAKMNLANAKDLANYQHSLALSDYALQRNDFIKDALLGDLRAVQSRQNAGLSTAFSKGFSPVQPLGASVPNGYTQSFSPSNVATSLGIENPLSSQNLLVDAQIDNVKADTLKKEKEAGLLSTRKALDERNLELLNENFPFLVDEAKQKVNALITSQEVDVQQRDYLKKAQDNLDAITELTNYDLNQLKPAEVQNMLARTADTLSHIAVNRSQSALNESISELNKTKNFFASRGIGVGSTLVDSILAIAASPNASKILPDICSNFATLFKELHDSVIGTSDEENLFQEFLSEVAHNKSMQHSLSKEYNNDFDAFFKYWRKTKVNGAQRSGEHSMRR